MRSKGYLYELPSPEDWWVGWTKIGRTKEFNKAMTLFIEGITLAAKRGVFDGEMRPGDIYVSGLPSDGTGDQKIMVGFKQDNNGTTFIYSEIPLSWLFGNAVIG
jgi:hypothetical protein